MLTRGKVKTLRKKFLDQKLVSYDEGRPRLSFSCLNECSACWDVFFFSSVSFWWRYYFLRQYDFKSLTTCFIGLSSANFYALIFSVWENKILLPSCYCFRLVLTNEMRKLIILKVEGMFTGLLKEWRYILEIRSDHVPGMVPNIRRSLSSVVPTCAKIYED